MFRVGGYYAEGDGSGGGTDALPAGAYGVISDGWQRYGSIGLVNDQLAAEHMAGLSNFGVQTIYPSPGNDLVMGASALEATPRVRRVNEPGQAACGFGNEIANGHLWRARDGLHLSLRIGNLLSGTSADGFLAMGALRALALTDMVALPSSLLLAVSPTVLATGPDDLHLVMVADDGTPTALLLEGGRIEGLLIIDYFCRRNLAGACTYAQIRAFNAETNTVLGDHIVTNPALIPQAFLSPFAISNRGTGEASFSHVIMEYGAGFGAPTL